MKDLWKKARNAFKPPEALAPRDLPFLQWLWWHPALSISRSLLQRLCAVPASHSYSSHRGTWPAPAASAGPLSPYLRPRKRPIPSGTTQRRLSFPRNAGNWNQLDEESLYTQIGAVSKQEINLIYINTFLQQLSWLRKCQLLIQGTSFATGWHSIFRKGLRETSSLEQNRIGVCIKMMAELLPAGTSVVCLGFSETYTNSSMSKHHPTGLHQQEGGVPCSRGVPEGSFSPQQHSALVWQQVCNWSLQANTKHVVWPAFSNGQPVSQNNLCLWRNVIWI